jgi:hypothetical protein
MDTTNDQSYTITWTFTETRRFKATVSAEEFASLASVRPEDLADCGASVSAVLDLDHDLDNGLAGLETDDNERDNGYENDRTVDRLVIRTGE